MSFLVLGMASKEPVVVDHAETIATSFPGFVECMQSLGGQIEAI
jgi:3-phosphoshikimate 1-carboxyvinyltransferase